METKPTVLVVEDNPLNLELVTDLLEINGFTVLPACNAEEALAKAHSLPDLVLMDLSLPGMDGIQATRAIRADPISRDLRVVALTAHAMKGDKENALEAGFDGYMAKPIDTRTFIRTLSEFLPPRFNNFALAT